MTSLPFIQFEDFDFISVNTRDNPGNQRIIRVYGITWWVENQEFMPSISFRASAEDAINAIQAARNLGGQQFHAPIGWHTETTGRYDTYHSAMRIFR